MTYVQLTSVALDSSVQQIKETLEGKTYMEFHVVVAPYGGMQAIGVETKYTDNPEELKNFILDYLTGALIKPPDKESVLARPLDIAVALLCKHAGEPRDCGIEGYEDWQAVVEAINDGFLSGELPEFDNHT